MKLRMSEAFIAFEKIDYREKGPRATPPNTWPNLELRSPRLPNLLAQQNDHSANRDAENANTCANNTPISSKSSEIVSSLVGVSPRTVNKFRFVKDWAYAADLERFRKGAITLQVCMDLAQAARAAKKQLRGNIKKTGNKNGKVSLVVVLKDLCDQVFQRRSEESERGQFQIGREMMFRLLVNALFKAKLLGTAELNEVKEGMGAYED